MYMYTHMYVYACVYICVYMRMHILCECMHVRMYMYARGHIWPSDNSPVDDVKPSTM